MKRRKDGRYVKKVTINGKSMYFYSKADSEKKAEKDIERQLLAYKEKKSKGPLFEEAACSFMSQCSNNLAETTTHRYASLVKRAKEYFSGLYIRDISINDIERFLLSMSASGFSSKTIRCEYSVVCLIFRHAYVNYGLDSNVCQYVKVPKGKPAERRNALTSEEQEQVNANVDKCFGLFAYFLMYTGARRGEAIALRYSDIDFDKKIIHIRRSAVFAENKAIVKEPKTEAGKRQIILLDCLAEKLPHKSSGEYVFSGKELRGNSWYRRRWKDYQNATGLDITPHQLRHTYATILFEAGISEKDAQDIMGHADIATTKNIYTLIRESRREVSAEKLNSYIKNNR